MASQDDRTHPNRPAFPAGAAGPGWRALGGAGGGSVADLPRCPEADLAKLHGMGPKALGALCAALEASGRTFRTGRG